MPSSIDGYVTPSQSHDITHTQTAITGKQKCLAYILLYIRGILQFTDFIKGQKLTLALRSRYLFLETQQLPGIALYVSLPPCRGQDDAENPETGTGGGLGERLSLRSERLGLQPLGIVGTEFFVHVYGKS